MRRRDFLAGLGSAASAALAGSACGPGIPPPPEPIAIPLAALPDGTHQVVQLGGKPVDVVRFGQEVVARSLVCPHTGCLVRWNAEDDRYHCACHDGLFDRNGLVIGGQADRPLLRLAVQVEGDTVTINPPKPGAGSSRGER